MPYQYPSGLPRTSPPCGIAGLCVAALTQTCHVFSSTSFPAGVNARPTMLWQTGGIAGGRQTWRADDSHGVSPLCVGADACIGPRYSAGGCRFRVISRSRPQCRAGDLARRMGACAAARLPGRCKHRPLRMRGRGPAGLLKDVTVCTPSEKPFKHQPPPGKLSWRGLPRMALYESC